MKNIAFSLLALLSLSSTAIAQDDVYFVPSKKTNISPTPRQNSSVTSSEETFDHDNWADHRYSGRDIDDYNRRSNKHKKRYDRDEHEQEESMTARIVRFRSPRGVLVASPWYDTYYYDLAFYDPWFSTWGWSNWYGYYDPWFARWSWGYSYSPWHYSSPWNWHWGWSWASPYYGWESWRWNSWYGYYNPWYSGWNSYPATWYASTPRNQTFYGHTRGSEQPRQAFNGRGESFGARNGGGSYSSRGSGFGSRSSSSYDLRSGGSSSRSYRYEDVPRSTSSRSVSRSGVVSGSRGGNSYNSSSRSYSQPSSSYNSTPSSSYGSPSRSSSGSYSTGGSSYGSGSRGGGSFGGGSSAPSRSGVVGGRR